MEGRSRIDSFKHYLRLYLMIETQYIKARLQYRADFIISSVGILFRNITGIFVFGVLLSSIPDLDGWELNELIFIYGFYLLSTSPLQIFFDHIWQLRVKVQDGSFIKYYFRPLDMMFYYMSEMFDIKGITQLVVGIVALVYASQELAIQWTPLNILLLLAMLLSASLVMTAIIVIAGCSSFWIIFSFPVMSLAFKLREYGQYPMSIFSGIFRFLFTYLIPIGYIAFYPSQLFLRPEEENLLAYFSPLVGVGMFVLSYWVWNRGVNSWTGTGS